MTSDIIQILVSGFIGLIVQSLFDFRIAPVIVKYLGIIPLIFGSGIDLTGQWEHVWQHGGSDKYLNETTRRSISNIYQLNNWCYAEFEANNIQYQLFGKIKGNHLVGEWYDANGHLGYHGAFQLHFVNNDEMEGKWIGHSQKDFTIRTDVWSWKRYA